MKPISNDIVLRPRFNLELSESKEKLLIALENSAIDPFLVKRIDEHIFIKFNKKNNHFWSPQLHLEIHEVDLKNCKLYGVFGPNPTLWTFFMFLHFGVATLFIILGVFKCRIEQTVHSPISTYGSLGRFVVRSLFLRKGGKA